MSKTWLPQVSAPFKYVLGKLKDEGVNYKLIITKPSSIKPIQTFVFSNKVNSIDLDDIKPIWLSNDYHALDGHHRYAKSLANNKDLKAVKLDLNKMDGINILNKIMEEYNNEKQSIKDVDEVVSQDVINATQDDDTRQPSIIEMIRKELSEMENNDVVKGKSKTLTGYRKSPIKENSKSGNFFKLKKNEELDEKEYEIEFDNLLDTNSMNLVFNNDSSPVKVLASVWFPNLEFDKLAKKYDVKPEKIMNRAICEKATKMGYDGIKYGDIAVQGLK